MKRIILIGLVAISISLIGISAVQAYTFGSGGAQIELSPAVPFGEGEAGTKKTVDTIFSTVITIAEVIFVVLFLIGGVLYMTGMGNEEQVGKARKLMIEAVIGIVIVLAAWAIGTWILDNLKGKTGGSNTTTSPSATSQTGLPTPSATMSNPPTP